MANADLDPFDDDDPSNGVWPKEPPQLPKRRPGFTDRLRESFGKPGFNVPPAGWPAARIAIEISPRAARCRLCNLGIPGKTSRVMIYVRQRRTFIGGGRSSGDRFHYHSECIKSVLEMDGIEGRLLGKCLLCMKRWNGIASDWKSISLGQKIPFAYLCIDCSKSTKLYAECMACYIFYKRSELSPLERSVGGDWSTDPLPIGALVCRWCGENHDYPTVRRKRVGEERILRYAQFLAEAKESLKGML